MFLTKWVFLFIVLGDGKGSLDNADRKKGDSGGSANGKVKLHIES